MSFPILLISEVSYVSKGDWKINSRTLLNKISLDVKEGESFGFLGHNGAGKTTTIKLILNLIRPTSGSIKIFGKDSRRNDAREQIGFIAEQPYFYDHLTVKETLSLYAALAGLKGEDRNKKIKKSLERVGLIDRIHSPIRTLSKGLTQRIALAQAIVAEPRLLILDEPFSGLDPIGRAEFRDIFTDLRSKGVTLFLSSHILHDVELLCDRISIMKKGEVKGVFDIRSIAEDSPPEYEIALHKSENLTKILADLSIRQDYGDCVVIRSSSQEDAERLVQMAIKEKVCVESFVRLKPSIEELFLRLTKNEDSHA